MWPMHSVWHQYILWHLPAAHSPEFTMATMLLVQEREHWRALPAADSRYLFQRGEERMAGQGRASELGAEPGESPGASEARTVNVAGSSWEEEAIAVCWGVGAKNTARTGTQQTHVCGHVCYLPITLVAHRCCPPLCACHTQGSDAYTPGHPTEMWCEGLCKMHSPRHHILSHMLYHIPGHEHRQIFS